MKIKNIITLLICFVILLYSVCNLKQTQFESFESFQPGTVYFSTDQNRNGRFGNNVFQYMAAEIIKKIYNLNDVKSVEIIPTTSHLKIDDSAFIDILNSHIHGNTKQMDTSQVIVLEGFFQRSDLLEYFRQYIKSLMRQNNCTSINSKIKVCDIVTYQPKQYPDYDPDNDLVLHLRLDDFLNHTPGNLFDAIDIREKIVKTIKFRKLYIVCDKLKHDWEKEYVSHFAEFNPVFTDGTMLDDYAFLMNAKRIIISQSTFAWTAVFLGSPQEVYIPLNPNYGPHTNFFLGCFSNNCRTFGDISLYKKN